MIKVAVTGAGGRMGSVVVQNVISSADTELVAAFDLVGVGENIGSTKITHPDEMEKVLEQTKPNVFVDFTTADVAVENIKNVANMKIALVVGTTGFSDAQAGEIKKSVEGNVAAIISPNFSVGVNVFWKIAGETARYLRDYDAEIVEAHHRGKKDAPSGTALRAAEIIAREKGAKLTFGREGTSQRGNEVGVHAVRGGDIVGEHTVLYAGDGERVEIIHRAHSRQAFASGVMRAIRWVVSAPKGVHSMEEVLGL